MKKTAALLLALIIAAGALSACGGAAPGEKVPPENSPNETIPPADAGGELKIVCTVFPLYDIVRQVMGERFPEAEVTCLSLGGGDYHSFQPTAQDLVAVKTAGLFVCQGDVASDAWADSALSAADAPLTLRCTDVCPRLYSEELSEGMQEETEEDEPAGTLDEHLWLSFENTGAICAAVSESLSALDGENAPVYEANAAAFQEKLEELSGRYEEAVAAASSKTLIFADRFPFRYLTEEFGLEYYAAFPGCSAECDAGFDTVLFLAEKADELGVSTLLITENSAADISGAVISAAGRDMAVARLNAMQSVSAGDAEKESWLGVMEENLQVIKGALG